MAVVTTKSTQISNRDASPKVLNHAGEAGNLKSAIGQAAVANGDSIASKYVLCSVPSNAMVRQVAISCSAITTCAADVGVYKSTADGGAAVDASFFGSAVSLASALVGSNITHESGTYSVDKLEKPLWQALGLASDPCAIYDIVATLTAAAGSAGNLAAEIRYV